MQKQDDQPGVCAVTPDGTAGEAAFQVLEMLLLTLIDKRIIDPDALIAEIESLALATPAIGKPSSALTLRGQLGRLAGSISACAQKAE